MRTKHEEVIPILEDVPKSDEAKAKKKKKKMKSMLNSLKNVGTFELTHKQVLLTLVPYFWPKNNWKTRLNVVACLFILIACKSLSSAVPFAFKNLVNSFDKSSFDWKWLVLYVGVKIFTDFMVDVRDYLFIQVSNEGTEALLIKAFRHLHYLSLRYHIQTQPGQILKIIDKANASIPTLLRLILFNWGPTLYQLLLVAFILQVGYGISYAAVIIFTVALYLVWTIKITNIQRNIRKDMNSKDGNASAKAFDSLLNFETVKYYNAEEHEVDLYRGALGDYFASTLSAQWIVSILNTGQGLIVGISLGITMYMACQDIAEEKLTVGDLVAINGFMMQLWQPFIGLAKSYRGITRAIVDVERLFELMNEPVEVSDIANAVPLSVKGGEIVFDRVSFSYDEADEQILQDISFKVKAGTSVAIVGQSGGGKSTIFRLLCRFYNVTSGHIYVDGQDISSVTQASLRKAIGVVPQDTMLFNDTVFYNLSYASDLKNKTHFNEIQNAAREAKIDEIIDMTPNGYDTVVGQRGMRLSGGEKQRIAIARAIIKNPPILIMDEATSSLDTKTEREIQNSLMKIAEGRTTVIIAHRLSTVVSADQILVLKDGNIVERGKHQELLDYDGEYKSMWEAQLKEQETAMAKPV